MVDTRGVISFVNIRSNEKHQDKDSMQELGGILGEISTGLSIRATSSLRLRALLARMPPYD